MTFELETLVRGSKDYNALRRMFFTARAPEVQPAQIVLPKTTAEVVVAIDRAKADAWKVGVRSGGHLFFCNSLLEDGLLIDTSNLNKGLEFDKATKVAIVNLGHRVEDVTKFLQPIGRFFPAGHSRSVALGGFLLAGGQGCFLRGWGYTSDQWIQQLEIVTSEGRVVIANKKENSDLFWAVPGSGQGYFAVVTRSWIKTIPHRKLNYKKSPKYGVDLFYCTFCADKDDPKGGHEYAAKRVLFVINQTIFVDSFEEAKVLASPWNEFPDQFKQHIVTTVPLAERTWEELWDLQGSFQPHGNGERWTVDSILVDPKVSDDGLIDAITPALYDLPSRLSSGTYCPIDYYPNGEDQALSLPQRAYVSTMCCWNDPAFDESVDQQLLRAYTHAEKVSCGVYVADSNVKSRKPKVMTDTNLKKWLQIREKWDPTEMFVGYRGFAQTLKL
ncbi:hypothetical protein CBER1_07394 [Cercospora berteroae]|uniref:FAD-binding PCMH-type domain-containing protein n=1 Tax=Cercospora berteroae TaxID=357750 RepID=A0A2S6CMX5_9PEZI|nr:hypothetical protein CBER1_07394 [Cercospora berteroae]